jgi:hypothetical protein
VLTADRHTSRSAASVRMLTRRVAEDASY